MIEIDLDKLEGLKKKGQPLTYAQLCTKLGLPRLTSNAKKSQLRDLETYCTLIHYSNPTKYQVKEIYPKPITILLQQRTKFLVEFEYLIYALIQENNFEPTYVTIPYLLDRLGVTNENFRIYNKKHNRQFLTDELAHYDDYIEIIFEKVKSILTRWFKEFLNKLTLLRFISCDRGYLLITREKVEDPELIKIIGKYTLEATPVKVETEQHQSVTAAYGETNLEYGLGMERPWMPPSKFQDYQKIVNKHLKEKIPNLKTVVECYVLTCDKNFIFSRATSEELIKYRFALNQGAKEKIEKTKQINVPEEYVTIFNFEFLNSKPPLDLATPLKENRKNYQTQQRLKMFVLKDMIDDNENYYNMIRDELDELDLL